MSIGLIIILILIGICLIATVSGNMYMMYVITTQIKTPQKSPVTAATIAQMPPVYLPYLEAIKQLDRSVTQTFQRQYTVSVLPQLMNGENQVSKLVPNDIEYDNLVKTMVLQAYESFNAYLEKSLFFYFDVKDKSSPTDIGIITLTKHITTKISALLNSQLIDNIIKIEKETLVSNSSAYIDSIKKEAGAGKKTTSATHRPTPDGTELTEA